MEDNKIIAKFMDLEYNKKLDSYEATTDDVEFILDEYHQGYVGSKWLRFNTSWDWLMPVVKKIESTQPEGFNTLIEGNNCWIETNGISFEGMGKTKIEATYKAVIEFIKWYNKNKDEVK